MDVSVSLRELTELCVRETGRRVPITSAPETSNVDLRIYVTDSRKAQGRLRLAADPPPAGSSADIRRWIEEHRETLQDILS